MPIIEIEMEAFASFNKFNKLKCFSFNVLQCLH